jgi:CMP-N-acetylneuraminic acid synthetase
VNAWTAVIPIRAGSKGLPGKNTRILAGRPLYMHAVHLALDAGAKRVLITTDIDEVLKSNFPEEVLVVRRPPQLSGDDVTMSPVLMHLLMQEKVQGPIVLLQATSPLRKVSDIQTALLQLETGEFDLVMSVTEAERSVLKWGTILDNKRYVPLADVAYCFANRQSLPPVYKPNGALYAMRAEWFINNGSLATQKLGTVIMPVERSQDIDNLVDFERCEQLMSQLF